MTVPRRSPCLGGLAIVLAAFLSWTADAPAAGNDQVATVVALRGTVSAIGPDGAERPVQARAPLFAGDTVKTGQDGRVQILFTDQGAVSLGRGAILKIDEYRLETDGSGTSNSRIDEGVFRIMGGTITRNSPAGVSTVTPSGTIGIRGSMYAGRVAGGRLAVVFEGGRGITLANETGSVVLDQPGFGGESLGPREPLAQPRRFGAEEVRGIQRDLAGPGSSQAGSNPLQVPARFTRQDGEALKAQPPPGPSPPAPGPDTGTAPEASVLTPQQETLLTELREAVRGNPDEASTLLRSAVNDKGLALPLALTAALSGLRNPSRESFDTLVGEAIDLGLTPDQARQSAEALRQGGGPCR